MSKVLSSGMKKIERGLREFGAHSKTIAGPKIILKWHKTCIKRCNAFNGAGVRPRVELGARAAATHLLENSNRILSPGESPGEATATAGAFNLSNVSDNSDSESDNCEILVTI